MEAVVAHIKKRLSVSTVVGVVEGVLTVRLVGLLLAVRPGNVVYALLLAISAPLVWPWLWIDRALRQPRFGARLELATLAAMVTVAVLGGLCALYRRSYVHPRTDDD
jgi:hypothetical protein